MCVCLFIGTTVMHPSYPRPMAVSGQINFVDIKYLEKINGFDTVRNALLTEKVGSVEIMHKEKKVIILL